jgi:putative hydrolase of the HAD superfamily
MDTRFSDVKILIWDFDGTLYPPNMALWDDIREAEYQTIMDHTHWPKEQVIEEFGKLHHKVIVSATEVVAHLCNITTAEAAREFESHYDRRKYVAHDQKLIDLFASLSGYRHFMLANGYSPKIVETLAVLGLPKERFEAIVTSELVGVNKPNEKGYQYILQQTQQPPETHMMIGDREVVDLDTAKKLGMKTCYVWSTKPSMLADITVDTVYDLSSVLT